MNKKKIKVIVGVSGGVDSSVSAYLLLQQGYDVEAVFMKNWEEDDTEDYCAATQDLNDAKQVCSKLNIKLHTINFASEYWDNVFTYFLDEYKSNRTPNPDILCNKEIKFKAFLEYAISLGADYIATGHYADIKKEQGQYRLYQAKDKNKDQTYFLYALKDNILSKVLFPLGQIPKDEVREIATELNLVNADKKDSTGICFIGERKFKSFLEKFIPNNPGKILNKENDSIIGNHSGLMYYTIGQRKGLGIGGVHNSQEHPWYVVTKDIKNNALIVSQNENDLMSNTLITTQTTWINSPPTCEVVECYAKIRHRQPHQKCVCYLQEDLTWKVVFENSQRAIAPGQSIVFYSNDRCLGGGIIK